MAAPDVRGGGLPAASLARDERLASMSVLAEIIVGVREEAMSLEQVYLDLVGEAGERDAGSRLGGVA